MTGVFRSKDMLEAAVDALLHAGFDRADIDLVSSVDAVLEKLGGLYAPAETLDAPAETLAEVRDVPRQAFLAREDVAIPLAGTAGILTYIGATAAAFGVVASGGALAMAVAAAVAGGAAAGGIGALRVRVRSPEREEKAEQILKAHGAEAVRVQEIEIDKRFEDMPLSEWLEEEPAGLP